MKHSQLDFRLFFENAPGLYIVLNKELSVVAVSNAFLKTFMISRDKILNLGIFEVFPGNLSDLKESLLWVLKDKVSHTMPIQKYEIRSSDGVSGQNEARYWSSETSPVFDSKGELINLILKIQDVTEELLETKTKIEYHSEEFDRLFNVSLDMLCISSSDGYFKRVNHAFESILGHTPNEMCSNPYLSFIHPDDIERTRLEVESQMIAGKKVLNFENRYRCKDGSYKILSWKSVPIGTSMYASARDVTDQSIADRKIRELNQDLQLRIESSERARCELENFSHTVTHILKSPVQSMIGIGRTVLEEYSGQLKPTGKDSLIKILDSADKMNKTIDGLLDLSKLTSSELKKELVNISRIVHETLTEFKNHDPNRKVHFIITNDVEVHGDERLLRSAIKNIISNSWKFTSKKFETRIEFGVKEENTQKVYYLSDNGAGFDMSQASKLFDPFQCLHSKSEYPGTGIGLATVHRIISRHGGEVWAVGAVNKGATFYFKI